MHMNLHAYNMIILFCLNGTDGSNQSRSHPNRPRQVPPTLDTLGPLRNHKEQDHFIFSVPKIIIISLCCSCPLVKDHHMVIPQPSHPYIKQESPKGDLIHKLVQIQPHSHMFLFRLNKPCDTCDITTGFVMTHHYCDITILSLLCVI